MKLFEYLELRNRRKELRRIIRKWEKEGRDYRGILHQAERAGLTKALMEILSDIDKKIDFYTNKLNELL